jgi:OTU domain-containing protein 3
VQEHREEFEPFVEDEVPFNEYCSAMREDGTWAGHMELQATSLVTGCNICIHQVKAAMLLSYCQKEYGFTKGK